LGAQPKLGSDTAITVIGRTIENFTLTDVSIPVSYKGFHLITRNVPEKPAKTEVANTGFIYRYSVNIPSYAFKGSYTVELHFNDNGTEKGCISISFTM